MWRELPALPDNSRLIIPYLCYLGYPLANLTLTVSQKQFVLDLIQKVLDEAEQENEPEQQDGPEQEEAGNGADLE